MTIARIMALIGILTLLAGPAAAEISDGVVKIGVLNDQSSLYADLAGQGSVVAARMAVEDFGAAAKGLKVEIIFAISTVYLVRAGWLPLYLSSSPSVRSEWRSARCSWRPADGSR